MGTFAIGTTIINAAEVTAIEQDGDEGFGTLSPGARR